MRDWLYFAFVQIVALVAMVLGWFILIIPCAMGAWEPAKAPYTPDWYAGPTRIIWVWKWKWLNKVWGNDEDGVVGTDGYNPPIGTWRNFRFRAYLWSAWRNSANNLRFVFRWIGGPFYRKEYKGWYFQCGWYANGFPVLSAGRI